MCCSIIASDIRQRWEVKTCAAALNSLSTAAELGSGELIFVKVAARDGYNSYRLHQLTGGGEQSVKIKCKLTVKTL